MHPTLHNQRLDETSIELHASRKTTSVPKYDDSGQALAEVMSYIAVSVVAIVAIVALIQALGVDIVGNVRSQLGL